MRHKLNLSINDRSKKRLERLMVITEADTSAEVVKNSLRLYEAMINRIINDEEILIRDKKTGDITTYNVFELDEGAMSGGVSEPETPAPRKRRALPVLVR